MNNFMSINDVSRTIRSLNNRAKSLDNLANGYHTRHHRFIDNHDVISMTPALRDRIKKVAAEQKHLAKILGESLENIKVEINL